MSNSSHTYNTSKALTSNAFTLPGYTFAGWNTKADGTGTSYSNGASVKNLTSTCSGTFNLYAQWTANTGLSCESGTYLEADTATCSSCPAGYYCTGVTSVTYNGSDQGITGVCKSGYSTGGAKTETCTACSSGYSATGTTAADHDASSDCKGNTITLAYNEDGGDSVSNGSCTYGSTFTLPSAATKDGSVFAGWKLNDGSVKSAGTSVTCNYTNLGVYSGTSTAITAQWTECGTGYWCSGGVKTACTTLGSGYTTSTTTATKNTDCYKSCTRACTQQSCPTNSDTCAHGTTTTSGIQYYGSSCNAAASTCSLSFTCNSGYSKNSAGTACAANTIDIDYNENSGSAVINGSCTYGGTFTLPAAPTRSGYMFAGWKLKDGTVKGASTSVSCNYTNLGVYSGTSTAITAQWSANKYTVSFDQNGGTGGQTSSVTATYDSAMPAISAVPTRTGYTFTG